MTVGAEDKKKVGYLVGIVVLGGIFSLYENGVFDGQPAVQPSPIQTQSAPIPRPTAVAQTAGLGRIQKKKAQSKASGAWTPRLGAQNPEDRPDPATVDPTLRFDLVAKVQAIEAGAPGRNLFAFGAAPQPPAPKVELPKNVAKIPINQPPPPQPQPFVPAGPPPPPQAPQMTFKYYGFKESVAYRSGQKGGREAEIRQRTAFLLDGDSILIAGENDVFLKRYRVVRIERDQITIEDTQFKSTQTIKVQDNIAL